MSKATFAIDRGGTFTDIVALVPPSRVETLKLLSVAPEYDDAPTEGIRRLLFTVHTPLFSIPSAKQLFVVVSNRRCSRDTAAHRHD